MAKAYASEQAECSDTNVLSSLSLVTFIKHCKEHHEVLPRVLRPISHQGPCNRTWDGSLYKSTSSMPISHGKSLSALQELLNQDQAVPRAQWLCSSFLQQALKGHSALPSPRWLSHHLVTWKSPFHPFHPSPSSSPLSALLV